MAKKRSVNTHFWNDGYISELEPDLKLMYLYLITSPLSNMLGVFEIQLRRIAFDTGLPLERVTEGFERLRKDKKADYIEGFVILVNFVTNQSYNHNMLKSAVTEVDELPLAVLKSPLFGMVREGFERVSKGSVTLPNIEVEVEVESEYEIEGESESKKKPLAPISKNSVSKVEVSQQKKSIVVEPIADIPERKMWDEYLLANLRYTKEFVDHLWDHLASVGWKAGNNHILDWKAYARKQIAWNHEYNQKLQKIETTNNKQVAKGSVTQSKYNGHGK